MSGSFSILFACILQISLWMAHASAQTTETEILAAAAPGAPSCYPTPSPDSAHYIVGYGSLMESSSKARTYQGTGDSIPVQVKGFRREWNLKGEKSGATFLGVVVDPKSSFNGVIFQILPSPTSRNSVADALKQYDKRERNYCRYRVDIKNIQKLGAVQGTNGGSDSESENVQGQRSKSKSEYWIYVNKPENVNPPAMNYPIIQSYVDVFISGCLELQEKFNLKDFAKKCATSTKGWSLVYYKNDRASPRYPTVNRYSPAKIDAVLRGKIPV